ncbi:MAG: hypothetical protein QGH57_00980 [Candidatus Thalassarchaeaceae archaeon]|nr:hypothetical protein [Euryarchaeota archaeon]MDP6220688.1 hypothetical protein [Candidatus Thalassarchaeaceae archaeon]MDP7256591.1 hypothetical protein [Candidatus Thalassarchaeaceae archaeon]MDP7648573.1 hypothetical protein [Candidatus Thalassarchaeaceae archaeon]HJM76926.1 hypothetical protein [Candidatus Thalassarchaeaceae archaeon]
MKDAPIGSNRRLNTVIAGWVCIALGAGVTLSNASLFALAVATPLSIGGVILLLVGIGMGPDGDPDKSRVSSWEPDSMTMPDAGRVMYRLDTTLSKPIRSSIICGRCAHLEWVEGVKPNEFTCPSCGTELWLSEEE